jgi:hypothetical protein
MGFVDLLGTELLAILEEIIGRTRSRSLWARAEVAILANRVRELWDVAQAMSVGFDKLRIELAATDVAVERS